MGGEVSVESAWGRGLVFRLKRKKSWGASRTFNERKREPQDPGLHVCVFMHVYTGAEKLGGVLEFK